MRSNTTLQYVSKEIFQTSSVHRVKAIKNERAFTNLRSSLTKDCTLFWVCFLFLCINKSLLTDAYKRNAEEIGYEVSPRERLPKFHVAQNELQYHVSVKPLDKFK